MFLEAPNLDRPLNCPPVVGLGFRTTHCELPSTHPKLYWSCIIPWYRDVRDVILWRVTPGWLIRPFCWKRISWDQYCTDPSERGLSNSTVAFMKLKRSRFLIHSMMQIKSVGVSPVALWGGYDSTHGAHCITSQCDITNQLWYHISLIPPKKYHDISYTPSVPWAVNRHIDYIWCSITWPTLVWCNQNARSSHLSNPHVQICTF